MLYKECTERVEFGGYKWTTVTLDVDGGFHVAYRFMKRRTIQVWFQKTDPNYFWIAIFDGHKVPCEDMKFDEIWDLNPTYKDSIDQAMEKANEWWKSNG